MTLRLGDPSTVPVVSLDWASSAGGRDALRGGAPPVPHRRRCHRLGVSLDLSLSPLWDACRRAGGARRGGSEASEPGLAGRPFYAEFLVHLRGAASGAWGLRRAGDNACGRPGAPALTEEGRRSDRWGWGSLPLSRERSPRTGARRVWTPEDRWGGRRVDRRDRGVQSQCGDGRRTLKGRGPLSRLWTQLRAGEGSLSAGASSGRGEERRGKASTGAPPKQLAGPPRFFRSVEAR